MPRSTIALTRESHQTPDKFRISYKHADLVLNHDTAENEALPVLETSSKVCVIGSGFSGMASAIKLVDLGEKDFTIFEKHDDFGGTWYANTYPGCASDIPAMWYSLSSVLNSTWSSIQPPQYEIQEYCRGVVEKYGLDRYAQFSHAVKKLTWNEREGTWTVRAVHVITGQVTLHTCKIVLSNSGGLVKPKHLDTPGLHRFKGVYMHSAVYDHSVSLKDKKVVVIGSGCSACQIVPALLKDYGPKSIVQIARSKQYIMPPVPPILQTLYRSFSWSYYLLKFLRLFVTLVAEMRFPLYKGNSFMAHLVRWINTRISLHYMNKVCPEKFKSAIIPDYKIGCKRLVFDNKYLQSLHDNRVDVKATGITEIVADGMILNTGEKIKADVIIACTGYDITASAHPYEIEGQNGFNVGKHWKENAPSAYRTTMVRETPNFFLIGGPNIATGHASFVQSCENALKFSFKVVKPVLEGKKKSVVVKTKAYEDWFQEVQAELKKTVYGSSFGGCNSWYTQGNYNFTTYPYSQVHFWWKSIHPDYRDIHYEDTDKKGV